MSKKKHEFTMAFLIAHFLKNLQKLEKTNNNNINRNTDASVAFLHRTELNHELNYWKIQKS